MGTKNDYKFRLMSEGRWDEFDQRRKNLKAEGYDEKEANRIARAEFANPSKQTEAVAAAGGNSADTPSEHVLYKDMFEGKGSGCRREIIDWVFDNIDIVDITPLDAPSSGAWSFLRWCRAYPELLREFYRGILAKTISPKSENESQKFEDDGRQQFHLIEQIKRARAESDER